MTAWLILIFGSKVVMSYNCWRVILPDDSPSEISSMWVLLLGSSRSYPPAQPRAWWCWTGRGPPCRAQSSSGGFRSGPETWQCVYVHTLACISAYLITTCRLVQEMAGSTAVNRVLFLINRSCTWVTDSESCLWWLINTGALHPPAIWSMWIIFETRYLKDLRTKKI